MRMRACLALKANCPSPHGEGGLKSSSSFFSVLAALSLPTRGGWIEMRVFTMVLPLSFVPPLAGWVD